MASKTSKEIEQTNEQGVSFASNVVSALVALIFVGVAGYFVYSYFNNTLDFNLGEIFNLNGAQQRDADGTNDDNSVFENDTNVNQGDSMSDSDFRPDTNTGGTDVSVTMEKGESTTLFGQWVANDYQPGDIEQGEYTVREGDTLWELAEGAYGDPYVWGDILAQNSNDVGYLPNGQQALIFPGQVLTI